MFRLLDPFLVILVLLCLLLLCNSANAQITRSATSQESLSSSAEAPAGASGAPAVALNGRYLVFESEAANIVENDSNKSIDIYLKDLTTGTITRQSVSSAGTEANSASSNPSISPVSPEGFFALAFSSIATNLGSLGGQLTARNIFVRIPALSFTEVVSYNSNLDLGNEDSDTPSLTVQTDPQRVLVAFSSNATNLVSSDNNRAKDIFLVTLAVPTEAAKFNPATALTRIKVTSSSSGGDANGDSDTAKISGDGNYIVFASRATNLVENLTTSRQQIFRYSIATGKTELISKTTAGVIANEDCQEPVISYSGRFVAYTSKATNLVSDPVVDKRALVYHDLIKGTITRINADQSALASTGDAATPAISANGRFVSFSDTGANLVSGDLNSLPDVFVKDTDSLAIARISIGPTAEANAASDTTSVAGGSYNSLVGSIYFKSFATNLTTPSKALGAGDIFSSAVTFTAPQLKKGTLIETPADVVVLKKRLKVTLQKFSFPNELIRGEALQDASIVKARAANQVIYEVRIKGEGARKSVRQQLLAKRNTVTSAKLKPGVYTTRYRALASESGKTVSKTSFSPRLRFEISK
jgi:hypothetical protein